MTCLGRRDVAGGALLREIAPAFGSRVETSLEARSGIRGGERSLVKPKNTFSCVKRAKRARQGRDNWGEQAKPVFFWEKQPKNENRTHTPPTPHHRAFDDGAAAASTRASPALALNITFHIKPMAHV